MKYLAIGIFNIICCNVLHIFCDFQYWASGAIWWSHADGMDWDFVLAQEQHGSLMQMNFVLLLDTV